MVGHREPGFVANIARFARRTQQPCTTIHCKFTRLARSSPRLMYLLTHLRSTRFPQTKNSVAVQLDPSHGFPPPQRYLHRRSCFATTNAPSAVRVLCVDLLFMFAFFFTLASWSGSSGLGSVAPHSSNSNSNKSSSIAAAKHAGVRRRKEGQGREQESLSCHRPKRRKRAGQ